MLNGRDFDGHVFRVTRGCPPTLADFSSYKALGIRYDRRDFFKGSGISTYTTAARAIAVGKRFALGSALAALDLDREGIVWSPTGRGHFTVWAAPATLLEQVVQCESYER